MNQESTAVITKEQQALLDQHAKEFSGRSDFPSIPRLKIAKEADPAHEVSVGDFVLTKRSKNDKDEWITKVKGIGASPTITIMLMKMRYSWYDNDEGKYIIQTNEFNSFSPDEKVIVFDEGKITHEVDYSEFKQLKQTEWRITNPRGGSKSALKLSYILYVVVEGIVAALTLPLSSYVGTNAEGKRDFKNPETGSLMALQNANPGVAPYSYSVQLSAEKKSFINEQSKQEITFFRTVFTKIGESDLVAMLEKRQELDQAISIIEEAQYNRGNGETVAVAQTEEQPAQPAQPALAPIAPATQATQAQPVAPAQAEPKIKVDPFA